MPEPSRVAILAVDRFGSRCHDIVAGLSDTAVDVIVEPVSARSYALVVIVASQPAPALAAELDSSPTGEPVAFAPLWPMGSGQLQVGPIVRVGASPCYGCYEQRERQHASRLELHDAIVRHRKAKGNARRTADLDGPAPWVLHAAGEVLRLTALIHRGRLSPGHVIRFDSRRHQITAGRVIPVHGCERCGEPVFRDRSWAPLLEHIGHERLAD